ncbi:MAG: glycosyltransferase family 4 protein [Bacteroides sp.]|nr:glycosyltransferase family 4 protein [Barnesiella sp.]MBD5368524.1 glycosyltransferase family 4 protein [Bacteroides sp.]
MNILYFTNIKLEPRNSTGEGVHKKIYSQIESMRKQGHEVYICHKTPAGNFQITGNDLIEPISPGEGTKQYDEIIDFVKSHSIDFCYIRNTGSIKQIYLTRKLRKNSVKVFLEIPTYPFLKESTKNFGPVGTLLRRIKYHVVYNTLGLFLDRIVTFSDDRKIWGVKTINISNGVDPAAIRLARHTDSDIFRITAVAALAFWHGYDRLVEGVKNYIDRGMMARRPLHVKIVGGKSTNPEYIRLTGMIADYGLTDVIELTGELYGAELDKVFDDTDVCVGSLGRHRTGNSRMKSLKNVEYAHRGLPFCYSESNSDFDDRPFTYKVPADDSAVDIEGLINFAKECTMSPEEIRDSLPDFSWDAQMRRVLDEIPRC